MFRDAYGLTGLGFVCVLVLVLGSVLVATVAAVGAMSSAGCDNRWADVPHRWEWFGGCIVQTEDGRWVGEQRVTVLQ